MKVIQLYNRNADPQELVSNITYDSKRCMEDFLSDDEREMVNNRWQWRQKQGFWDSELGALWDTQEGLSFIRTSFSIYDTIAAYLSGEDNKESSPPIPSLSSTIQEVSRTSAVGSALETVDGYVLVQRRSPRLLAGGKLDSSASGMCVVKDGTLDFQRSILDKIAKELQVSGSEITLLPSGVHCSMDYGSIQVTYKGKLLKTFEDVQRKVNPDRIPELIGVPVQDLPSFIIDHYAFRQDLIGDGCAALFSSLDSDNFTGVVAEINQRGGKIKRGVLVNGFFKEDLE